MPFISFHFFCDHIIFVNKHDKKYFKNKLNIKVKSTNIYGAGVKKIRGDVYNKRIFL